MQQTKKQQQLFEVNHYNIIAEQAAKKTHKY